jgi:serine-type D-Ala-D-Ala carboxypeptidase/endopeptidase
MPGKTSRSLFLAAAVAAVTVIAFPAVEGMWDTEGIRSLLVNRITEGRKAAGIIVGLVDRSGRQVFAEGRTAPGGTTTPGADTVFEIGSITKVFTSLVLADMVEKGEVRLDDPIAKYLPAGVKVPSRNGREITLLDLSTQVSGLPRLPYNLKPSDPDNPYVDYGPALLYGFLSGYSLMRDPGEKYEYSNLGVGLLGHVLALRAGKSYEETVRERILVPLGMNDTFMALPASRKSRLAVGSGTDLRPVKNWDFDVLAGAGALKSTAADMMTFLAAAMDLTSTPLRPAFRRLLSIRKATGTPDLDIAMGWHIWKKYGSEIVWHNGGTNGYRSFAGYDPERKAGVVVLCNTSFGVDDIGLHALDARYEAGRFPPPRERKAIEVDPALLEACVGEYELSPELTITVTRAGGRLYERATGQAQFELFAESPTDFFLKMGDIQITFVKDATGVVTRLVVHQNGRDRSARRIK